MSRTSTELDEWIRWNHPNLVREAAKQASTNSLFRSLGWVFDIGERLWDTVYWKIHFRRRTRIVHAVNLPHESRLEKNDIPVPLPVKRKRALTLPLPPAAIRLPWATKQRTNDQDLSSLLFGLPLELRNMIWNYVLSGAHGDVVHVFNGKKRMHHRRCKKQVDGQPCLWVNPCAMALPLHTVEARSRLAFGRPSVRLRMYNKNRMEPAGSDEKVLSLLLTCRKIYSETIALLYQISHFHFPNPVEVVWFGRSILPHRLNTIRKLSMDLDSDIFDYGSERIHDHWELTGDILAQMQSLQELRIFVKTRSNYLGNPTMRVMLEMMKKVLGLKVLELVVPFSRVDDYKQLIGEDVQVRVVGMLPQNVH